MAILTGAKCVPRSLATAPILLSAFALLLGGCDLFHPETPTTPHGDTGNAVTHVRGYGEFYGNGGVRADRFNVIRTTSDGGYVALGMGGENEAVMDRDYSGNKIVVVRTNADGSVAWQFRFSREDISTGLLVPARANDLRVTSDGGCVIVGGFDIDAVVIKLNRDGQQVWSWRVHPDHAEENVLGDVRAEAFAVDERSDGSLLVAFGTQENRRPGIDPWIERAWVQSFDAQGSASDRWGIQVFDGGWPDAIVATDDGGFVLAGHENHPNYPDQQKWLARYQLRGLYDHSTPVWLKSYGEGEFRGIERRGDGFVVLGVTGSVLFATRRAQVFEIAGDGGLTSAHELGGPGASGTGTVLEDANSIHQSDDGGYLIAGTAEIDYDHVTAWAAKIARGSGTTRTFQWQEHLVGPRWVNRNFPGSEATSVDAGVGGGFRIAGRVAMLTTAQGRGVDSNFGWVIDLRSDGGLTVNPMSGTYALSSAVNLVDVTSAASVVDLPPDENLEVWDHSQRALLPQAAADMTIETMSGPTGALNSPAIGTNDPGEAFYWTNVPDASGFILFHSVDGINYTRDESRFDYGSDLGGEGFYKVVAFNASGYSDFSSAAELRPVRGGGGETPGMVRLTVTRIGSDGLVTSAPGGIDCGGDCTEDFPRTASGTQVMLTAHDGALDGFSSWSGCDSVSGNQCTVQMLDHNRIVTADYLPIPR